jgi:mannose-1-phosphate guanylyltransferase
MHSTEHLWAILLAAGDGVRVRPFTTNARGESVPKQYYAFNGHHSMLRWTVNRAVQLVPQQRIVAVVANKHRRWWRPELSDLEPENILVQPQNRGTAAGLLLPLFEILHRDPQATILVLPSDHYVADEACLAQVIVDAIQAVQGEPDQVVLVGMTPQEADTEYGWIVPSDSTTATIQHVAAFEEKPDRATAQRLKNRGALLNSLILVAVGRTLLHLYDLTAPDLVGEFVAWHDRMTSRRSGLDDLYPHLPTYDFSKQLLERSVGYLSVIRASPCGWSDLGTPGRLQRFRVDNGLESVRATA